MMRRLLAISIMSTLATNLLAQDTCVQSDSTIYSKIYQTVIDNLLPGNSTYLVLVEQTYIPAFANRKFRGFKFRPNERERSDRFTTEWEAFFDTLDSKNRIFVPILLPFFESVHKLKRIPVDSIKTAANQNKFSSNSGSSTSWHGNVRFSNILLSSDCNKAILMVEIRRGPLDAWGELMFLDRSTDGQWVIIRRYEEWGA
jgi:hypothetical protein